MILKAIDSTYKSKRFSSQPNLQAFKGYICIYKERKGHLIEENQEGLSNFFQNKPVQRINEETRSTTNKRKTAKNEWENDD